MKCKIFYMLLIFKVLPIYYSLMAQNRQYQIRYTEENITVDGFEDSVWAVTDWQSDFFMHLPIAKGTPSSLTKFKLLFNDQYIYVLIQTEQKSKPVVENLKRDNFENNDAVGLVFDLFDQKRNGIFLGVTSEGAQSEGEISADGEINFNLDIKWLSEVQTNDQGWIAEFAIPFYSISYPAGVDRWGLNVIRNDQVNNEASTWTNFDANFEPTDLGYTGELLWEHKPPPSNKRFAVIPSIAGTFGKSENESVKDITPSLDLSYGLSPSLNLNATINPDFSQIEVDEQVTNLSRFELFFPERRTFFLDNNSFLSDFGSQNIRPYFSRKIGLDASANNVPITFGVGLSGNINPKTGIAFINVKTADTKNVDASNYSVLGVEQRVLKRSSVRTIIINEAQAGDWSEFSHFGTEYLFSNESGSVTSKIAYFQIVKDDLPKQGRHHLVASFAVNKPRYRIEAQYDDVGENYLTEVGFNPRINLYDASADTVIRQGFRQYSFFYARDFRPRSGALNFHGPRLSTEAFQYSSFGLSEFYTGIGYEFDFRNQHELDIIYSYMRESLMYPVSILADDKLLDASTYEYNDVYLSFNSDPRKKLSYGFESIIGSFYNGQRNTIGADITLRIQPWLNSSISYEFNDIDLQSAGKDKLHLLQFENEVSFSTKIFWTTFIQFNTQNQLLGINSRLQWRYLPMSDVFIVINNNWISSDLRSVDELISVKINYWFNLK